MVAAVGAGPVPAGDDGSRPGARLWLRAVFPRAAARGAASRVAVAAGRLRVHRIAVSPVWDRGGEIWQRDGGEHPRQFARAVERGGGVAHRALVRQPRAAPRRTRATLAAGRRSIDDGGDCPGLGLSCPPTQQSEPVKITAMDGHGCTSFTSPSLVLRLLSLLRLFVTKVLGTLAFLSADVGLVVVGEQFGQLRLDL